MGKKAYLITGGMGFLGAALVRRLLRDGHRVRVLDDLSRGHAGRLADLQGAFEFVEADIRDAEAVQEAVRGMDAVCHFAFVNGTEYFYSRPDLVLDVGVKGIVNAIDACLRHGVGEFAFASSSEVYQTPPAVPTDESAPLSIPDPLNPRYSYAGGKVVGELMALNYGRRHFERVLVFRPHNVYGPDMGWEHAIPQLVARAVRRIEEAPEGRVPFEVQGDGSQTRAFVHVDDFTEGLVAVLERGAHMGIYHIGNDEEVTVRALAERIFSCLGRQAEVVPGRLPAGSPLRRCPDIGKVRALGYRPKIPLEKGLPGVVEWYRLALQRVSATRL